MSVGVPVVPIGTMGLRGPSNRAGLRHSSVPSGAPRPPVAPGRSPNGVRPSAFHWARSSGLSGLGAVGVKLFTRIPYGARSIAAARTKLLTPPLWNAYAHTPALPFQPLEEEMQTIEPLIPRWAIASPTYLVLRNVPIDDTVTARWNASAVSS